MSIGSGRLSGLEFRRPNPVSGPRDQPESLAIGHGAAGHDDGRATWAPQVHEAAGLLDLLAIGEVQAARLLGCSSARLLWRRSLS